ncbi:MAG TPA: metal ABC transporter ATP-binding protein [Candidatus Portnoybacteria bacterium]|nr:metal ABC transporter ATP-binding protein [Candidatus Portnoybacteria bacterium]
MSEDLILKVKNLNIELDGEKIIKDLSFQVKKGEFYIILGPNGVGKTTLFKSLLGLIPYSGKIIWAREGIKIGYLPERLSRLEFKKLPISVLDFYRFKENSVEKISEMLDSVGLKKKNILNKNPGDLSSGQFQRVLIGWALLNNPQILFFDEPTTGIDIGGEETIYSLLKKFWQERGLTILLITHDLNIVYGYATNVLCLHKSGLCFGPPREVLTPERLEKLYGNKIKFYKHNHE